MPPCPHFVSHVGATNEFVQRQRERISNLRPEEFDMPAQFPKAYGVEII